ncbi:integral membrane protein, YjbE family [Seinonella peptonophila]|uniref:Integral membrane protein, YjbE family n=1 Tax=Seinonella peptonophila TaxID=112248 RepID=A0A1M4XQC6_9BACL|nr:TerC family protein [Seinonella peptonophila]SHE95655.1 integral membrane protein, YjbE family [Seinonella peptonophila]
MELFTTSFLTGLLTIIIIDLVLAGDNAIVIGMAARNLPPEQQKKVIFWGTAGAVILRIIATLVVVYLLHIPGLLLIGGLLLLWIAFQLLTDEKDHNVEAGKSTWAAIRTIIVADAVMGLDNVLAIAGAAHNNYWLVIIGLLVSVPIVVWGSTLFIKLLDRYPFILYIGSAVLAWTAAKMMLDEKLIKAYLPNPIFFQIIIVAIVLLLGWWIKHRNTGKQDE